jgi:ketosteroid isomerase-like protein
MSQETIALVRSGFSAFEQGDVSRMLDLMADDLVTYRADPDGATYHGKEGFLEATADWTEGFSEWAVVPEKFIDAGDFVVVYVRQIVRGEASGISVEGAFWFVFEVHDARITRLSFYVREIEALEAAGVGDVAGEGGPPV